MKVTIGRGNTIEDATQDALKQLSAKREEVEVEPLTTGSKGFLGIGKKPATVKASIRSDDKIRASVFMRNILKYMKIDSPVRIKEENDSIEIQLNEEASSLIGHHGQTLDSLQYLVARYLNEEKEEWRKVVIDIDNYRDKREDNLKSMALRLGEQVARTKRDVKTDPLSPPERRIIHMTLKENDAVTTFSIGSGTHKRVVIASTDKQSQQKRRSSRSGRGGGGGRSGGGRPSGRGNNSSGGGGGYRGKKRSSRQREGAQNR